MLYLKDLTTNEIKRWLVEDFGKDVLHFFQVHMHKEPLLKTYDKAFLIRTKPKLLNHPFRMWILSLYNENNQPVGYVWINNQALGKQHQVSNIKNLKKKIFDDVYAMIQKIQKIYGKQIMSFKELVRVMKNNKFRFGALTNDKSKEYLYGSFSYVPVYHFSPSDTNSHYDETLPIIRYNLKTKEVTGYTDDSQKENDLFKFCKGLINEYFIYETGKGIKNWSYTPITRKAINKALNEGLDRLNQVTNNKTN